MRSRGARGSGRGRGDTRRPVVPAGSGRASATRPTRRLGRGRDRRQKENAGAPRCARHGDADRQRRRQGAGGFSEIVGVHFRDGAMVRQGDVLFTLDGRQIEAEIKRVEAVIAGAEAQLEQASRDVARYTELVARNATTLVTLNNAQTQVNISARARGLQQGDAGKSQGSAQLLHHPGADHRTGQHGQCEGRQLRPPSRPHSARDHHPDLADLRDLHGAAAISAGLRQALAEETATVEAFMPG